MKKEIVINYIKNKIDTGEWKSGQKILSEYQLIETLNVSRGTVRNAIKDLIFEGVLETIQGSGIYVKNINTSKNKYILILTNNTIINKSNNIYRFLIEIMKKEIIKKGYSPICFAKSSLSVEESLGELTNSIAGVISIFPSNKDKEYFKDRKIPLITGIYSTPLPEPTIVPDYEKIFQIIRELIDKYKFKDISVFSLTHDINRKNLKLQSIFLLMEYYFEKYNLYIVNKENEAEANKILNKMEKAPECIVILDDTIYNRVKYIFETNELFKNTKIITQFSYINRGIDKNTCKIITNIEKIGLEAVNLIIKLAEKKYISDYNVYVQPVVENEEGLM